MNSNMAELPPLEQGAQRCIFCSIACGITPSHSIFSDSTSFAFLDKRPLFEGHSLLIPTSHVETLTDLPSHLIEPLFANAKLIAAAVQAATNADGTFLAINNKISQSVSHLHIHIVPRRQGDGLRGFFWPRRSYASEQDAIATSEEIKSAISKIKAKWAI
jgi:histidine triad (HIT) family protein